jgi:hypothetical protein
VSGQEGGRVSRPAWLPHSRPSSLLGSGEAATTASLAVSQVSPAAASCAVLTPGSLPRPRPSPGGRRAPPLVRTAGVGETAGLERPFRGRRSSGSTLLVSASATKFRSRSSFPSWCAGSVGAELVR